MEQDKTGFSGTSCPCPSISACAIRCPVAKQQLLTLELTRGGGFKRNGVGLFSSRFNMNKLEFRGLLRMATWFVYLFLWALTEPGRASSVFGEPLCPSYHTLNVRPVSYAVLLKISPNHCWFFLASWPSAAVRQPELETDLKLGFRVLQDYENSLGLVTFWVQFKLMMKVPNYKGWNVRIKRKLLCAMNN